MGIYLPTITSIIDASDVMEIAPDTWHGAEHLLKKYWESGNSYQCTTNGYNHLNLFFDPISNFKLKDISIYYVNRELGITWSNLSYIVATVSLSLVEIHLFLAPLITTNI